MVRRLEVVLERHRTVPIVTDEDAPDHLAILSNRDVRVLVVPAGVVGPHLQRDVDGRRIVRHVDGQVVPLHRVPSPRRSGPPVRPSTGEGRVRRVRGVSLDRRLDERLGAARIVRIRTLHVRLVDLNLDESVPQGCPVPPVGHPVSVGVHASRVRLEAVGIGHNRRTGPRPAARLDSVGDPVSIRVGAPRVCHVAVMAEVDLLRVVDSVSVRVRAVRERVDGNLKLNVFDLAPLPVRGAVPGDQVGVRLRRDQGRPTEAELEQVVRSEIVRLARIAS